MMQCQIVVTWARMHYTGKRHKEGLAQAVNRQGFG
jgi:hypothetical protein